MIQEENLNKLYELIINDNELTTQELKKCDFNQSHITSLIETGKIERIKRGYYKFIATNELYYYGKFLISKKEYEKATQCFKKCYEIDTNHQGTNFQLFIRSIQEQDYENAFVYYETLTHIDNEHYIKDNNFYLYLLSIITDVPDKYKEYARNLTLEDIKVDISDRRYKENNTQNKIRLSTLQRKFPYALKLLNDINDKKSVQEILIRTLLHQSIKVEKASENKVLNLINSKEYDKLIIHLETKEKRHNLSLIESYILKLSRDIIKIKKSSIIPEKNIFEAEKIFAAIDGYNYELALQLNKKYNEDLKIEHNQSATYLLLEDICNLIKEITISNQKEEPIEITKETTIEYTYLDVLNYLMEQDVDKAINILKEYMNSINKNDYIYIIVYLIKLSLLERDITFTKPIIALTYISKDNYTFNLSEYIQNFYIAISKNNIEQAKIYLDIIKESERIGQKYAFIDSLTKVLELTENKKEKINYQPTIESSVELTEVKEETKQIVEEITPSITEEKPAVTIVNNVTKRDSEVEFIERNCQELLQNKGVILLKPMDKERRKRIHNIIEKYDDIESFSISEEPNRQIVLRYKPKFIQEKIDIKEAKNKSKELFSEGKYEECIEINKKLLAIGKPTPMVYATMGFCLIRTAHKNSAIDYLTIGNEISKQNNQIYDFSELIASLKGEIEEEDKKPKFKMTEEEFTYEQNYGIDNFEEINNYIMESGLDVESACVSLHLNEEQRTRIKLLYAREYYAQGQYEKGDEFLKAALKNQNKSKFTLKTIEELLKNKKFYINRIDNNKHTLTLTLKPEKRKKTSSK